MALPLPAKEAVAGFSQHFMHAVVGMQMRDLNMEVLDPQQFATTLACALYAASQLKQEGLLGDLPGPDDHADYTAFGEMIAARYAVTVNDTAVALVDELSARLDPGVMEVLGMASTQNAEQLAEITRIANGIPATGDPL